jgi:hypothetical protein
MSVRIGIACHAVGVQFLIVGMAGIFAGTGAGRNRHVSARRAPVASESMNFVF